MSEGQVRGIVRALNRAQWLKQDLGYKPPEMWSSSVIRERIDDTLVEIIEALEEELKAEPVGVGIGIRVTPDARPLIDATVGDRVVIVPNPDEERSGRPEVYVVREIRREDNRVLLSNVLGNPRETGWYDGDRRVRLVLDGEVMGQVVRQLEEEKDRRGDAGVMTPTHTGSAAAGNRPAEPFVKCRVMPITENGKTLENPEDGFIVVGNIFVSKLDSHGMPHGGLIGRGYDTDSKGRILETDLHRGCYSKGDMLDALSYTNDELVEILRKRGLGIEVAGQVKG